MAKINILPSWTQKVTVEATGRDPLGLSRVSAIITDYLLKGIITQTDRARYYSFYCWALWHISRNGVPSRQRDFIDYFRRLEAFMALSTLEHSPSTSPVGVVAVRVRLQKGKQEKEVECDFKVLPSNSLGGYGQYYAGSLFNLGLTQRLAGIDQVAPGYGEELAKLYQCSVEKTPYLKKSHDQRTTVPLKEFLDSSSAFSLDAVSDSENEAERNKLIDLFFSGGDPHAQEANWLRRSTLGQILHVVSLYEKSGVPIDLNKPINAMPLKRKVDAIDWYLAYSVYYYHSLWLANDKIVPYQPPKTFELCHSLWKQFCLQQFLTQALEQLLVSVIDLAGSKSEGLSLDEILSGLLQDGFYSVLEACRVKDPSPCGLMAAFKIDGIPNREKSLQLQQSMGLASKVSEVSILNMKGEDAASRAGKAVLLLAMLYGKWRGMTDDPAFSMTVHHAGNELWFGKIMSDLDSWLERGQTWPGVLREFINTFVLDQHDKIMFEKRRLDSCWLERNESKFIKIQDYEAEWRASRHRNVVSILRDLNLLAENKAGRLVLTSGGKKLLNKLFSE